MSGFWNITELIHRNNHTQFTRECNISRNHIIGREIVQRLSYEPEMILTNLYPGLYVINIDGIDYYFDIPYYINELSDYIKINKHYDATIRIYSKENVLNLYTQTGNNLAQQTTLDYTIQDHFDMLVISGNSVLSGSNASPTNPARLTSISNVTLNTGIDSVSDMDDINEPLTIDLKNNIKSLPNGVKDTFYLDANNERHHITFRIGRDIFSGNEAWVLLKEYSNDDYKVFYSKNDYVSIENSDTNINCTHFPCIESSILLNKDLTTIGIATCNDTNIGQGFLVKINKSLLGEIDNEDDDYIWVKEFNKFLYNQITTPTPTIVEYELKEPIYKSELLDEYHIHTYYPRTNVKIVNNYDISYFYKTVKPMEVI